MDGLEKEFQSQGATQKEGSATIGFQVGRQVVERLRVEEDRRFPAELN